MKNAMHRATQADGKDVLRILESSAAKGSLELIYTRRPDAYESYMQEPGEARVFVSRDGERVVGTCAELIRSVYIGKEVRRAAYICGLKKDAAYKGSIGFGADFVRQLAKENADFYYCSVVADNKDVQRAFEKSRRAVSASPLVGYRTYILSPRVRCQAPARALTFRQAQECDRQALLDFLHNEGKRQDLFPVLQSFSDYSGLDLQDFYVLLERDEIVAAAALWNQTGYRQYVVKRYRGVMRLARAANPLLSALGYIRLPREQEVTDFPMLSFFACKNDDMQLWRILFCKIKEVAAERYGMLVIGLPHTHYAAPLLNRLPGIRFDTVLYRITFPWNGDTGASVDAEHVYVECGLL